MNEKEVASRRLVIAAWIICIILVSGLVGVVAYSMSILSDKNRIINSLNSEISQLNANNVTTLASINEITLDPSAWVNRTVVVEGKLNGPLAYPTGIPWYYELSVNGTITPQDAIGPNCIGVDLGNKGSTYESVNAVVIGVIRKGEIGMTTGTQPRVTFYIEAEYVLEYTEVKARWLVPKLDAIKSRSI